MTKTRILASIVALATVALLATPARASNVTVYFGLSVGRHAPTEQSCSLSVPPGSDGFVDGIEVLDAAVAEGCIASWDPDYSFGPPVVKCIDEVCGWPEEPQTTAGLYWQMLLNGEYASAGIADYHASAGDDVEFSFTNWNLPCTLTGCPW